MGSLAATWMTVEEGKTKIRELKSKSVPFFLNFVLHFDVSHALALADEGVPAVTFSWGCDRELIRALRERGIKVGVQTGSVEGAIAASEAGADFVIAQGIEAGGHVQSTTALASLLSGCVTALPGTPVVAAGGISTGKDIAGALNRGAAAVMMGTRYIASRECLAHESYKAALVQAKSDDTVFTNCFDIDWPYAMHRVLRNKTFTAWEAAGCPASPSRPGEGDVIGEIGGKPVVRYCDTPPGAGFEGSADEACLYAGTSVDGIETIEPAFDLTNRLWRDAQHAQKQM
jgi:nitronate monooxygenase